MKRRAKQPDPSGHEGLIECSEAGCRTKCICGFHSPKEPYPYLAIEPLIQHFKKSGTLIEDFDYPHERVSR